MFFRLPDTDNEYIIKRRKKILYKQYFCLFVVLVSTLAILCLKHPIFNIKNIEVFNNKNIQKQEIVKSSQIYIGNNIFYVNTSNVERDILRNPYILNVNIKRKIPNKICIYVTERQVKFYNKKNKDYIIVDKQGIALQKKSNIKHMNLLMLEGLDFNKAEVGKTIPCDDKRKYEVISKISNLVDKNISNIEFSLVDIKDLLDIKIYSGNMCIKIGTSNDLEKKLNRAINVLKKDEVKGKKGYIDVSYDGNPVLFIEK
ncbi:cell division protein DivIB [Clostridium acetireducens DSM 10703]|uniref:Cell division protein DivIB n=1 Tax=Clostridium acetireducens DSM 10703 TaxID=1121290 RepID=A0A1E8F1Z2_9CLOT|nr:FtsQ-type POTRA domain-containing protein [Clostridium acetireducens]OFI07552.1 cell division protein DivIB [Clostridium acetireducens DSM 10703]